MYNTRDEKENNAQRSERDHRYKDDRAKTVREKGPSGSYHETTYYSDGSFSVDHGHCGTVNYDKYGREC